MLISLNWLKDFVDIPKSAAPEELARLLTLHTVEVESTKKQAAAFARVVVGKIIEIKPHPQADKLRLALVDTGEGRRKIVCGAPNIEAGQLVPVALPGAELPGGAKIEEAVIRGEKSSGMLCAEDELGLGEDHAGIMILDRRAKVGQNLADFLGLNDVIFELDNKSITHRSDLWSHYGLAREIAAFTGKKFKAYRPPADVFDWKEAGDKIEVAVEDHLLCPRYMAVVMDGIRIGPSPDWMRSRLIAAGMRPISNIVDITNYVMLELGQPLHAFDRARVDRLNIRRARRGELLETLDGQKRELGEDILVIAAGKRPLAIAGVMGGAESEIGPDTQAIVIESANFDFLSIRRAEQRTGLRTDASVRFEKALDPNLAESGMARAVELVLKTCPGARVTSPVRDVKRFKLMTGPITVNTGWLSRRIGAKIEPAEAKAMLNRLGFEATIEGEDMKIIVPTWRAVRDIREKEDIAEEVARLNGYNNLPYAMPKTDLAAPAPNKPRAFEVEIKEALAGAPALTETMNYSFVGAGQLARLKLESGSHIALANPVAGHQELLRQSLVPNLIGNIVTNQARHDRFGLFEIGMVYLSVPGPEPKDKRGKDFLPLQEKRLAIVCAGRDGREEFRRLKGIIEFLAGRLRLAAAFEPAASPPAWAGRACAGALINGREVGAVALLDGQAARQAGVKKEAAVAEIRLAELFALAAAARNFQYEEYEKHPPVVRDLAFVVDKKIAYAAIKEAIAGFHELIREVRLFDVYEGGRLGEKQKSLAFHIVYQGQRTLTAAAVDSIQAELVSHLAEKFGAKIRDF